MKTALLLVCLALPAAAGPARDFDRLKAGVYDCEVRGMLCAACASAIVEEVRELEGVEAAEIDFDRSTLRVTVARGRSVPLSWVRRALGRAARRIDLGPPYTLGAVRYVP